MSWAAGTRLAKIRAIRELQKTKGQLDNHQVINGNWASVAEALQHEDLFKQRILRITEWFRVWNSSQRCQFFSWFLKLCTDHELEYLQGWFIQRSPVLRQDFTTVLPKELSLYIFSFLDPKSLSRSAGVSWHWRFLTEQDGLWIPKCARFGWFLPYVPAEREYGAWKYHYIDCVEALDTEVTSLQLIATDQSKEHIADRHDEAEDTLRSLKATRAELPVIHFDTVRPSWQGPDKTPRILEGDYKATLKGPLNMETELNRKRESSRKLQTAPALMQLTRSWRTKTLGGSFQVAPPPRGSLYTKTCITSKSLNDLTELHVRYKDKEANFRTLHWNRAGIRSKSLRSTIYQTNAIPIYTTRTSKLSTSLLTNTRGAFRTSALPRVVFISSRMPAKEFLLECTLYGILVIPYDYEATTLDSMLLKLELLLGSRQALSIAFVIDGNEVDGELHLVQDIKLNADTMQDEMLRNFWRRLVYHLRPSKSETVDIYWPIATTERGLALITEIQGVTGVPVSCPVGFSGSYNRFETDWLIQYVEKETPLSTANKIFNMTKLRIWGSYCKYLDEVYAELRILMKDKIESFQVSLSSRIVGETLFKISKLTSISAIEELGKSMGKVLKQLWDEDGSEGVRLKAENMRDMFELEFQAERKRKLLPRDFEPSFTTADDRSLETRFACVQKMIENESNHVQNLRILKDVYQSPLLACLQSNRGIVSQSIIRIIFSDCETLLEVDENLLNSLLERATNWTQNQHIGDVYVKFSTNLKAYCNFLNNYPAMLSTLQKCREENPIFRAYLEGQRQRSEARGMSLIELLVSPAEILWERCRNLSALLKCTPQDHEDRRFITSAQDRIQKVADAFRQAQERCRNEEVMASIKQRIESCPELADPGRVLLKEMHVSQVSLSPDSRDKVDDVDKMYFTVRDLALFLFDDVLVVTRKLTRYRPFSRASERRLVFSYLFRLDRLKADDISDSKYLTNSFKLSHGGQRLVCQASCLEEKLSYLSVLNNRIKLSIPLASSIVSEASRGQ